ncbi:hypothetical protein OCC_10474 [Thermococcus litoralis DSM 5473]|uniref:Uncharacterized protein n=1 Tax=Thermococcus litoralis (strain ATCC 51850 / DSM 5473 / JCM 8560 / NS-C) TaxID=523849 RepID=H3ZR55_THELN|nr:PH0542 domain-containing protein [Thermococcus litoralis]EHR77524.1 hypothetical protein OCC_10474 [Thermococcus litoralis DSM 5473]
MEDEEINIRELLANGEDLDKILILAESNEKYLNELIGSLDDDLWIVAKNALSVISELLEKREDLYSPLITKLMGMIRKSEATLLTQEIAKTFGKIAKNNPHLLRKVIPLLFANYNIGNWKIKINMAYVIEEIARNNPSLLMTIMSDIKEMLLSSDPNDKLVALNFIVALGEHNFGYVSPYLPKLLMMAQEKNEVVKASALEALISLAEKNVKFRKIVLAKLEELDDPSPLVQRIIQNGMSKLIMKEQEE